LYFFNFSIVERILLYEQARRTSVKGIMDGTGLCEIRPSANKGLGIFATTPIRRGWRVVCEKPLFIAPKEPGVLDINDVFRRFTDLHESD
jgi:hypothetical protein